MTQTSQTGAKPIVLAYSGGLDTSFLVPWVAENYRRPIITVTVDTGGIDAAAAKLLRERSQALGADRAPPGRCARRLLRAGAAISDHGQRAPRPALSAVRRRRARDAGADHRAHGAQARQQHDRARLHRRRQRPGALRSGAAHAGAGSGGARAGARPRLQAQRGARVPAAALAAGAAVRRRLFDQPRPVGRDHRRQGNPDLQRQHSRRRLGADARCFQQAEGAGAPQHPLRARPPGGARRQINAAGGADRTARGPGRAVWHRPRDTSGRHHHRHQGSGGIRSARGRDPADRAPRTREAGAHAAPAAHQGTRWRSPTATWCTRASCSIRCAATSRRCCCPRRSASAARCTAAASRLAVRRGRGLAVLADGRIQGRVRRGRRRMEPDRCARLLQDRRADRRVPSARRRSRAQAGAAQASKAAP